MNRCCVYTRQTTLQRTIFKLYLQTQKLSTADKICLKVQQRPGTEMPLTPLLFTEAASEVVSVEGNSKTRLSKLQKNWTKNQWQRVSMK